MPKSFDIVSEDHSHQAIPEDLVLKHLPHLKFYSVLYEQSSDIVLQPLKLEMTGEVSDFYISCFRDWLDAKPNEESFDKLLLYRGSA